MDGQRRCPQPHALFHISLWLYIGREGFGCCEMQAYTCPREELLCSLVSQPGSLAKLDTYLKRQQEREALQHAREFLRQHSQQGQHDPFALQHTLSNGSFPLGMNGMAEVGMHHNGVPGRADTALVACGPLGDGLRGAPDLNLPPPMELDVPVALPPPQLVLKAFSSVPSLLLDSHQNPSSTQPSSVLPFSISSAPQMTASSVRVNSG